ncbi:hypothetical protein LCM17_13395 [Cereibacter sphaeroides]|nr:hypothetical protein [Cereibacter sphaeroides]
MFAFLLMFGFLAAFSFGGSSPADETPPEETPDDNIIDGTEEDDLLIGTEADELIRGYGGDDTLEGGGGFDTLEGGAGNDHLTIEFGGWLFGGEGDDTLIGSSAEIYGGAGDDLMQSGGQSANFHFDGGNDTAIGDDGLNQFHLYDGFETALIDGQGGEDQLWTELAGEATLDAEGQLIFEAANGGRAVADGIHALIFNGGRVDASAASRAFYMQSLETDSELIGSAYGDEMFDGTGNDLLHGGDGNDTMTGFYGHDTLYGGGGDDYIQLGANGWGDGDEGDDRLYGELGSTLFGGADDDQLIGGSYLDGGTGDDSLASGEGEATLLGGDGDDTLNGAGYLHGGDGDDLLYGFDGAELTGGDGNDLFSVSNDRVGDNDPVTIRDYTPGLDHIEVNGSYSWSLGEEPPVFTLEADAESNSVGILINGEAVAIVEGTTEIAAEDITFYQINTDSGGLPEPVEIA